MDVDFKNEPMEDVLEYLLSDLKMEYKILANNILVRKSNSYISESSEVYKSSIHLRGKVTNASKAETLDFATVSISNSTIGTYTDKHGRFDIEIPAEHKDETLNIQYLGYQSAEYKNI